MNLVWHIIRKDIRRHWLGYLIWLGLLMAKVAICAKALTPASADIEWFERLQLFYGLTTVIAVVTGFLLAASFALDDELVGTRMFWATRPISGMRLLVAKATGLAFFFVVVPVLVWVPWWLYCGSGVREIYVSAVMTALTHGLPALLALLIAALTGKSSRFLLLLLSALLLCLLVGLFSAGRVFALPAVPTDIALARDIMALVLCTGGVFGAIWLQYRSRRTSWSTAVAVLGVGLGIWALKAWPWAFTQTWRGETKSDAGVESVEIRLVSLQQVTRDSTKSVAPGYTRLQVKFHASGVSESLRLSSGRSQVALKWADGACEVQEVSLRTAEPAWIARALLGVGPDIHLTDPETKAFHEQRIAEAKAKRGKKEPMREPESGSFSVLTGELIVSVALAERLEREQPECRADVRLDFRRPVVQLETPLVVGSEEAGRGARVRVVADLTDPKLKAQSAQEAYTVAHYNAVRDSWLYAAFRRRTGSMNVRQIHRMARPVVFSLLVPFSRDTVWVRDSKVRRGEEWVPAPGADETPVLAVASYEGLLHAERQCELPTHEAKR